MVIRKRNYKKLYGLTQRDIVKTWLDRKWTRDKIQEIYKMPRASLRRCIREIKQQGLA